ncbi:MAG: acetamidase/formamidase family protein [Betaproteobacteria bacterium]|nr:acetamidase/formamidase family protein [Betaproteobacteria bacterium]
MLEGLVRTRNYTPEHAYVITGAARDLRIGNVVDVPNYAVSTICPLEIFRKK